MSHSTPSNTQVAPIVLMVDDHADTLVLMSKLLRTQGFAVVTADSVAAATAAVDGRPVDLLVSDLSLTDGTGHDVMRHLRTTSPQVKGIALSGHGGDDDRRASHDAGFSQHLTKPVDFAKLVQACRELLAAP